MGHGTRMKTLLAISVLVYDAVVFGFVLPPMASAPNSVSVACAAGFAMLSVGLTIAAALYIMIDVD